MQHNFTVDDVYKERDRLSIGLHSAKQNLMHDNIREQIQDRNGNWREILTYMLDNNLICPKAGGWS